LCPCTWETPSARRMLAAKTRVSRCLTGLVRVDIGLAAASLAGLAVGFVALLSEGTDAIWSGSTELRASSTDAAHPRCVRGAKLVAV
jgi:hypothetical protein